MPTDEKRNIDPNVDNIQLLPEDHFLRRQASLGSDSPKDYSNPMGNKTANWSDWQKHANEWLEPYTPTKRYDPYGNESSRWTPQAHIIADPNGWRKDELHATGFTTDKEGFVEPVFAGSATLVNPTLNDEDPDYLHKEKILRAGMGVVEDDISKDINKLKEAVAPTSPFQPFTRMDPLTARRTNLISYNRTHTPIADLEFRKCFRHVFITRPECYIMCDEGGLSEQAQYDEDFASMYSRMPYLLEILSPRYLAAQSMLSSDGLRSNINYLLSNRVLGLSFEPIENASTDGVTKTTHNFTVSSANAQSSGKEGTLTLSFRDTKYFEVFEMIRMWMLYEHKRHIGVFAPPFNGYKKHNDFNIGSVVNGRINLHPYDRALEYPCTIFDVITDETDSRILHYSAYIGAYPFSLAVPLTNDNASAITSEMRVQVGFKYSAKITNNNRILTQFNYNAGICDHLGRPTSFAVEALPFLISYADSNISSNAMLTDYIGQSSLFTGTPYIVLGESHINPIRKDADKLVSPYLKFAPVTLDDINMQANMGITNNATQTTGVTAGTTLDNNRNVNYYQNIDSTLVSTYIAGEYNRPIQSDLDEQLESPSISGVMDEIKQNNAKAQDAIDAFWKNKYWFWMI